MFKVFFDEVVRVFQNCLDAVLFSNTSPAMPGALAHLLQQRNACNTGLPANFNMATRGPQIGQPGLERGLPLGFLALEHSFLGKQTKILR